METFEIMRRPGRPKAIPNQLESLVILLYRQGLGYRAISRILGDEYGVSSHYTTVKRVLKRLRVLDKKHQQ